MLCSPSLVVPSTDCSRQLKEKTKVKVNPFNAAALRKKKTAKDKGAVPVQPTWAPNIPISKSMMPDSAASLQNETNLSKDSELQR